jgi:hypothetical protein
VVNVIGSSTIFSQTDTSRNIFSGHYVITGNVSDSSGKFPIYAAAIIVNKRHFTYTGQNGDFKLLLPIKYANKNFSVFVAEVGFAHTKLEIKNKQSTLTKELNIHLKQVKQALDEVITVGGY